jgi:hypothetical protein
VLLTKAQRTMETPNLSGRKRPRHDDGIYCCIQCEKCQYMFQEVAILKQQLNEKIEELNHLIESINYRFNDKGELMSYIS